jgi:hypothetical protein
VAVIPDTQSPDYTRRWMLAGARQHGRLRGIIQMAEGGSYHTIEHLIADLKSVRDEYNNAGDNGVNTTPVVNPTVVVNSPHGPHEICTCPNPTPGRPFHCAATAERGPLSMG